MQPGKCAPRTPSPSGSLGSLGGSAARSSLLCPLVGTGPHCHDSFLDCVLLFFSCCPTELLPGAQVWSSAPRDHPTAHGSPGNPGGSPAPGWSFGRVSGGGGSESPGVTGSSPRQAGGTQGPSGHLLLLSPSGPQRPHSPAGQRCDPGRALLWQQDVVWDVTSAAACHPSSTGVRTRASPEMSSCCFAHQPVPMLVHRKEHFGRVFLGPCGATSGPRLALTRGRTDPVWPPALLTSAAISTKRCLAALDGVSPRGGKGQADSNH